MGNLKTMVTIAAVGDLCPGDKMIMGAGIYSYAKRHGYSCFFKYVGKYLKESDFSIGNLEGLLSSNKENLKKTFCGSNNFADVLRENNFKVISVANNHAFEHGPELLNETVKILENAGIYVCGLRGENKYYSQPAILDIKGIKFGFLAYNWVGKDKFKDVDNYIAQSHDSIVNYTWERKEQEKLSCKSSMMNQNVLNDIKQLKNEADIVVLLPHWGFEFVHYPPYNLTIEARSFVDVGVDIIIGSHPHVIQGYEKYNSKYVFYSMGNLLFDMREKFAKKTAILKLQFSKYTVEKFNFLPCIINSKFQPVPIEKKGLNKNDAITRILETSNSMIQSQNRKKKLSDDLVYSVYEKMYNKSKWINIFYHFIIALKRPSVFLLIIRKCVSFVKLIFGRLLGKKVRW